MLLTHAVKYHEARDWVRLQDQSKLTYQALLNHCKLLEQHCEQFHQDAINKHPRQLRCSCCGYNHSIGNCLASGQQCYNCNGIGHYTALCKKPRQCRHNCSQSRYRPRTSSNCRHPSISPNRSRPSRKASKKPLSQATKITSSQLQTQKKPYTSCPSGQSHFALSSKT